MRHQNQLKSPKCLFDKIGAELILQILQIVQDTCPSSFESVSRTSWQFYLLAQKLKYSTLRLTFSSESTGISEQVLRIVSDNTTAHDSVRVILIHCFPYDIVNTRSAALITLQILVQLIPRLPGLKQVVYKVETSFNLEGLKVEESSWDHDFGILPAVLDALHKNHPQCRLSVSLPLRIDLVTVLSQLANSSCLKTLIVAIANGQHLACRELFRILPTCPNLKTLKILSGQVHDLAHECLYVPHQRQGQAAVRLHDFDWTGPAFCSGRRVHVCLDKTSPFEYLDPSSLNSLSLTRTGLLLELSPTSLSLRYLSLDLALARLDHRKEAIKLLLPSIFTYQRLEELYLTGCFDVFTIVSLNPLKDTLKRLKIHENEDQHGICRRRVLSNQAIEKLGETVPKIGYLGLDVNYCGQWPTKTLSTISKSFVSLIHQELNLEINISNPNQELYPAATLSTSLEIWYHVWSEIFACRLGIPSLVPQPRLRTLTINAGSFRCTHRNERHSILPLSASFEQREQQTFHVCRHENAEKAAQGIAHVTCAQVEDLERKFGTGPTSVELQEILLEHAQDRAENGVSGPWTRGRSFIRPPATGSLGPRAVEDIDLAVELQSLTLLPDYARENFWLGEFAKRSKKQKNRTAI